MDILPLNHKIEYKEKFEALLLDKKLRTKMGIIARQVLKISIEKQSMKNI
jgi:hypothetical protein